VNVTKIIAFLQEDEIEFILEMAMEIGFDPAWLERNQTPKKMTPGRAPFL